MKIRKKMRTNESKEKNNIRKKLRTNKIQETKMKIRKKTGEIKKIRRTNPGEK